jgi:hypothetical protein
MCQKAEIITIVNTLIEENGLSPPGEPKTSLKTPRKMLESQSALMICPNADPTMWEKKRLGPRQEPVPLQGLRGLFRPHLRQLTAGSYTSERAWDAFVEGMLCNDSPLSCLRNAASPFPPRIPGG